jgi:hypothetical protein
MVMYPDGRPMPPADYAPDEPGQDEAGWRVVYTPDTSDPLWIIIGAAVFGALFGALVTWWLS